MVRIIAIDPGITTGIATSDGGSNYKTTELSPYPMVWHLIMNAKWDFVVCENFTAQDISRYGITTVRIIGGLEALCVEHKLQLRVQRNIDRLPYKHKAVEIMGSKGPRDHEMDALSHLLNFEASDEFRAYMQQRKVSKEV